MHTHVYARYAYAKYAWHIFKRRGTYMPSICECMLSILWKKDAKKMKDLYIHMLSICVAYIHQMVYIYARHMRVYA